VILFIFNLHIEFIPDEFKEVLNQAFLRFSSSSFLSKSAEKGKPIAKVRKSRAEIERRVKKLVELGYLMNLSM
jgi:hypothetical protein